MKRIGLTVLAVVALQGVAYAEEKQGSAKSNDFPDLSSVLGPTNDKASAKQDLQPYNPPKSDAPAKAERPKNEAVKAEGTGAKAEVVPAMAPPKPGLDVSRMIFDAESIRQVVKFHMPEIQDCYEKVLAETGKKLQGRVMVAFVIGPNGLVQDAKVMAKKTTLRDDRIHDCVLELRRWEFPKPGDERQYPIEYPFDLKVLK